MHDFREAVLGSPLILAMNHPSTQRQQIIEAINTLSEESCDEILGFIEHIRSKTSQKETEQPKTNFLLSIAGIGISGESNVSERDEEILATEIDPVQGLSLKSRNSQ